MSINHLIEIYCGHASKKTSVRVNILLYQRSIATSNIRSYFLSIFLKLP